MNWLDILRQYAGSAAGELVEFLQEVRDGAGPLAGKAAELLEKLGAPASPENLAALGSAIPSELLKIVTGKIAPKSHPSDLVG